MYAVPGSALFSISEISSSNRRSSSLSLSSAMFVLFLSPPSSLTISRLMPFPLVPSEELILCKDYRIELLKINPKKLLLDP